MEVERYGEALSQKSFGVLRRYLFIELFYLEEFFVVWIVFVEFLYWLKVAGCEDIVELEVDAVGLTQGSKVQEIFIAVFIGVLAFHPALVGV
jgi:hypothetical protein